MKQPGWKTINTHVILDGIKIFCYVVHQWIFKGAKQNFGLDKFGWFFISLFLTFAVCTSPSNSGLVHVVRHLTGVGKFIFLIDLENTLLFNNLIPDQ